MDMETISVIIPVYNVEDYLGRCLESVCNQTYKALEIILVDDGSSDDCPEICDSWAGRDRRIRVIHQENRGLSAARNAGLKICRGDYVIYIDSDDYILRDTMETLLYLLKKHEADVAVSTYRKSGEEDKECFRLSGKILAGKTQDMLEYLYSNYLWHSWAKLIKRRIAVQCPFDERLIYEDYENTPRLLLLAKRIVISMDGRYQYTVRNGSIMERHQKITSNDLAEITDRNLCLFQSSDYQEKTKHYLYGFLFEQIAYNYHRTIKSVKMGAERREPFLVNTRLVLRSHRDKWLKNGEIGNRRKGAYLAIVFFPGLYRWAYLAFFGQDRKRNSRL